MAAKEGVSEKGDGWENAGWPSLPCAANCYQSDNSPLSPRPYWL